MVRNAPLADMLDTIPAKSISAELHIISICPWWEKRLSQVRIRHRAV